MVGLKSDRLPGSKIEYLGEGMACSPLRVKFVDISAG
jgi:hypothetical protein